MAEAMNQAVVTLEGQALGLPMLLHVSQARSHVASRVAWHAHEAFELLFLLEGATGYEFAGGAAAELHGGHFLVIPPGVVHRGRHDLRAPCTLCGLAFRAARAAEWKGTVFAAGDVRRLREQLQSATREEHPFTPALRWYVRRLMQATADYACSPARAEAAVALRALICGVLVEIQPSLAAPAQPPKVFVSAAIAYLRQHLRERVSMSDLARHVGFGRARMFDLFKAETGLTPHDYLQRLRVEKAQQQLRQTNLPITEIALSTGFSSHQHFCAVFSRYTGLSPARFRKNRG